MKKILSEFFWGNSCAVRALVAHLLPYGKLFCQLLGSLHLLSNLLPNIILTGSFPCQLLGSLHLFKYSIAQ